MAHLEIAHAPRCVLLLYTALAASVAQYRLFLVVAFFTVFAVPSIHAQEHPVTITTLRCD